MNWQIANQEEIPDSFYIDCTPDPDAFELCCEYNCDSYIWRAGGEKVEGCYVIYNPSLNLYQYVRHFVVKHGSRYIDITPYSDNRDRILFTPLTINLPNMLSHTSLNSIKEEYEIMYYIYAYINPETNLPLYIGKGKQDRAFVHKQHALKTRKYKNNTRFLNKLEKLIKENNEPKVIFLAQNITDENIAYELEEFYIKQYGRQGYDEGGILLNVCIGARPPNKKGQTYKDIYGDKWEEQVEKRRRIQKERGGFGPKKHSEVTRKKLSERSMGENNPRYGAVVSEETKKKISLANKGKRRADAYTYKLDHSDGRVVRLKGITDAKQYCLEHGLSWSTFQSQVKNRWPRARRGKNLGWRMTIE